MSLSMVLIAVILAYGLVIGSFLNVVIYRLPRGENLAYPRSHCPNCNTALKAYDLVPVFSFLSSGGKCRYCSQKISRIYPCIEIVNAVLYLGIYFIKGFSGHSILFMATTSILICIAMVDLAHHKIPNSLNIMLILLAVIAVALGYNTLLSALLGAVVGCSILIGINLIGKALKSRGFGMGDIKYMLAIGALLGLPSVPYVLFYTAVVAGATLVFNLGTKRWHIKTEFAFGPFLVIGTYIVMLFY